MFEYSYGVLGHIYQVTYDCNLIVGSENPVVQIALRNLKGYKVIFEEKAWTDFLTNFKIIAFFATIKAKFIYVGEYPAINFYLFLKICNLSFFSLWKNLKQKHTTPSFCDKYKCIP